MIVWKDAQPCTAQLGAIDERCMTQFVEQDDVVLANQRRNRSERGCLTAAKAERRFSAFPFRQRGLQTQMRRVRPTNQSGRARTDTKFRDRFRCCLTQMRVIREAEVIVRGKVDQLFAVNIDHRSLRTADLAEMSI